MELLHNSDRKSIKYSAVLVLVVLAVCIGIASVSAYTIQNFQNNGQISAPEVQLLAGPDSTSNPQAYPAATVNINSAHNSAEIALSLFPSVSNIPQPATFYTNLVQIKNTGHTNHTIKDITVSGITGASNLGSLTIYYYANQTDSPQKGVPIGQSH
jgi:hypothetical protein